MQKKTRDDARQTFTDLGLTTGDVKERNLARLGDLMTAKVAAEGNVPGFKVEARDIFVWREEISGPGVPLGSSVVTKATLTCSSDASHMSEAVLFDQSGIVSIAKWADDKSVQPIIAAFQEWAHEVSADLEAERHVFMTAVDEDRNITDIGTAGSVTIVATARPKPGSRTERVLTEVNEYAADDVNAAVVDFFERMRDHHRPGVLDTASLRAYRDTPLAFCERLTEEINEDIPDGQDPDARDDDFDNHPLADLREAMVEASPEFSGEDASPSP